MSAQQSCISAYGFDVVVATTQAAINANIKQYIHEFGKGKSPTFTSYYMMNGDTDTQIVNAGDVASLISSKLSSTDPLTVAAWNGTGAKPAAITNIQPAMTGNFKGYIEDMVFRYAISFELGFPGGTVPSKDIVQLSDDGQYATYTLCFQNLNLTVANYNNDIYNGITSYEVYSQTTSKPYEFTVRVPVTAINDNTNLPGNLPANSADAFTVQQLVLDLDNASWYSQPVISDAPATSAVYKLLTTVFLPLYAQIIAANGRAVVGFNCIPKTASSSFPITNLQLQIDDVNSEWTPPAVATLDYLCAVNGNAPQAPADFSDPDNYYLDGLPTWNWFDTVPSVHGVIAISPSALANYFSNALMDYVKSNCYSSSTNCYVNGWQAQMVCDTPTVVAGQTPTVSIFPDANTLVSFNYTIPSGTGHSSCDAGHMQFTPSFSLSVTKQGNNIAVTQNLKFYLEVECVGATASGNIVDTTITDVYTLATDPTGNYAPVVTSNTVTNGKNISINWFEDLFDNINQTMSDIASWANSLAGKHLTDLPVTVMQGLIFPGGNTFSMNEITFSDGGDLIAYINYATPSYMN